MMPKPSSSFEWVATAAGPALVCRPLDPVASHFFTTRGWALGSRPAPDLEPAWTIVAQAAGVAPDDLLRLTQVHGADAVIISGPDDRFNAPPRADIIACGDSRFAIAVQAADCVPLLMADRRTGATAAAHAGWRGLAAGVPRLAVMALDHAFGCRPADLVVAIGPSIGACCYEVGDEVRGRFGEAFEGSGSAAWFLRGPAVIPGNPPYTELGARPGRWFFDGWRAARDQLEAAGVPAEQIHESRLCTASHADILCSYRRDGSAAGRIAGVIRPTRSADPK